MIEQIIPSCPSCFSSNVRKDGTGADGRGNLRCTECGLTFRSQYLQRGRDPSIRDQMIRLHQRGLSTRDIAARLNVGKNTVHRHIKRWRTDVANWSMPYRCLYGDGRWQGGHQMKPLLTVLNFSGGTGSTLLLEAVLRGELKPAEPFVAIFADPGMEKRTTYALVETMAKRCVDQGITLIRAEGPNLYRDLLELSSSGRQRIDNPPYFTKKNDGTRGQLRQCCTQHYKIRPMDRAIRKLLQELHGIHPKAGKLGTGTVEKWLGISFDEAHRIKPPHQKYVRFRYPLVDLRYDKAMIRRYYTERGLTVPDRSVCNACFAHSTNDLQSMHRNAPDDWVQAATVDKSVRDWKQVGVHEPVYISAQLMSLADMESEGFRTDDEQVEGCDSGYCFV